MHLGLSLYFSRNRLTELPSCVGKVKNLKSLHIEYNKISKLCEEMGELIHLEDLVITCDSGHFCPAIGAEIPFPIEISHLFSQYHVCFSELRIVKFFFFFPFFFLETTTKYENNEPYQNVT